MSARESTFPKFGGFVAFSLISREKKLTKGQNLVTLGGGGPEAAVTYLERLKGKNPEEESNLPRRFRRYPEIL